MNRKGFTLIELLIVVVIIGILAAIAIRSSPTRREKAYLASMKWIPNLVTAESVFRRLGEYTNNLGTNSETSAWLAPTINVTANGYRYGISTTTQDLRDLRRRPALALPTRKASRSARKASG